MVLLGPRRSFFLPHSGHHHFLSGHPSAAKALLNAKTQPHWRQRSWLVLALSMCSQSRQMANRRSRSSLLAALRPLVAKVLALSIRFLAIAEKPGISPGLRFLKPMRCRRILARRVIDACCPCSSNIYSGSVRVDCRGCCAVAVGVTDVTGAKFAVKDAC